ncbi:MAG: hypothetical protein Q8R01_11060 [Ramlibacter sp.]|nr:hypothetical protein [Ramlibacter sp.]
MSPEDEAAIYQAMRAAREAARGYADFFGWATDRDLEEQNVTGLLAESLHAAGALFFAKIKRRGRGNDPPDLEALDTAGERVAIEVTELVDGRAIQAFKAGRPYDWAEWDKVKFLSSVSGLLKAKNVRFPKLKDGPYPGGYIVLTFTDEPELSRSTVESYLSGHVFTGCENVKRAFLLLSYDPAVGRCPYFELVKSG